MSVQRGLVAVACVTVMLVGGACSSEADGEQVPENVYPGWFIALVVFGLAAVLAPSLTNRLRDRRTAGASGSPRQRRWPVPAVAGLVLALAAPLMLLAGIWAVDDVAVLDPSFDSLLPFSPVPAVLVGAAAIRYAHAGVRQTGDGTAGRVLAVTAAVFAYIAAALMLTALVAMRGAPG